MTSGEDIRSGPARLHEELPLFSTNSLAAYAAWTLITEPLDATACALVTRLGALEALDVAAHGTAEDVANASAGQIAVEDAAAAQGRWHITGARGDLLTAGRNLFSASERDGVYLIPVIGAPLADHLQGEAYAPIALWGKGSAAETLDAFVNEHTAVAITGSRDATKYGAEVSSELVRGLASYDDAPMIFSGGAYGIDAAAHRSARESGSKTLAVLAGGLDRYYPAGNELLFDDLTASGGLLSPVPVGVAMTRVRSRARNEILGQISNTTVIVEARTRSSCLRSARAAISAGKTVGIVPGPINSAQSQGCHTLLQEAPNNTYPVTSPADIMEVLIGR